MSLTLSSLSTVPTICSINSTFGVSYGAGGASGPVVRDTVVIGGAVASSQVIGASNDTTGFGFMVPFDGIRMTFAFFKTRTRNLLLIFFATFACFSWFGTVEHQSGGHIGIRFHTNLRRDSR